MWWVARCLIGPTPLQPYAHPMHEELPFPGLQNLGNTCYLNTALQVMHLCMLQLHTSQLWMQSLQGHMPHACSLRQIRCMTLLTRCMWCCVCAGPSQLTSFRGVLAAGVCSSRSSTAATSAPLLPHRSMQ
jgi:hypothetical protein